MAAGSPRSGGWGSMEEELAYYKAQYETLEVELQEFQASSKELEAELEKDVEESEKRERRLQEKVEGLGFEVEEWKAKYKESKTEANSAQNILQKEVTALRDSQRSLQLKLRDIEVQNDGFEQQARHQNSSLEDLESKYNVAIERTVMLDEEIKIGEQERENLRIESQRLRDELSDVKIEADILQEKLHKAEKAIERQRQRKTTQPLSAKSRYPRSPMSDAAITSLPSPTAASSPLLSKANNIRAGATPPSPPLSEASLNAQPPSSTPISTPMHVRKTSAAFDPTKTPRPGIYQSRHSRTPSMAMSAKSGANGRSTPSIRTTAPAPSGSRPSMGSSTTAGLPRSGSLYQIRGLIGKMQKLEERVYSARSKLPAPTTTPPRASPRTVSAMGHHNVPNTVTVRNNKKRASGASSSTKAAAGDTGVSRLSFGVSTGPREPSSNQPSNSRPSSRASGSLHRPASRSSIRTPIGHYSSTSISGLEGRIPRSRSSMSGHSHTQSLSMSASTRDSDADDQTDGGDVVTPMARRLSAIDKSAIPTPSGLPRRQSAGRRTSIGMDGDMGPPARPRKMSEIGETY